MEIFKRSVQTLRPALPLPPSDQEADVPENFRSAQHCHRSLSAGICAKISLTTLSYSATILSTLPHSRHNNPGEKVQYSTKRNRACKQQYQFQKITKPINKKMIVSDAKSSPNIGKYLIFSPLSNLFQFFHNKSKQLCLFPPSQKTDRHKMPLSTVPSQNFHLQNKYHFLHCLYETKSALFQPIENQHC